MRHISDLWLSSAHFWFSPNRKRWISIFNFAFFIVKSPSVTQRSASQENTSNQKEQKPVGVFVVVAVVVALFCFCFCFLFCFVLYCFVLYCFVLFVCLSQNCAAQGLKSKMWTYRYVNKILSYLILHLIIISY